MFDVEINDSKILIKSLKEGITEAIIYTLSPWDNTPKESITHKFKGKNHWVIFPFEIKNRSKIVVKNDNKYHSFILPHNEIGLTKRKIICVGLNKTGTTSLAKGLKNLGLKGYPENIGHQFLTHSVLNDSIGSTISAIEDVQYDFYEDMPFSFPDVYKRVFKTFPNEKYIITVRDNVDKWVKSCMNFYGDAIDTKRLISFDNRVPYSHMYCGIETHKVYNWGHPMFKSWGIDNVDNIEEKLRNVYLKHIKDFIEFMEDNGGDYLVVNVARENELKKIADWLDIDTELNDFEHLNKTNSHII